MDKPKKLFESLTSVNDLENYIENRQSENLQLDFKEVVDAQFKKDTKKNLAKVLSAVANAEGGVS